MEVMVCSMEMIAAVVDPDKRNANWSLKERVGEDEEVMNNGSFHNA